MLRQDVLRVRLRDVRDGQGCRRRPLYRLLPVIGAESGTSGLPILGSGCKRNYGSSLLSERKHGLYRKHLLSLGPVLRQPCIWPLLLEGSISLRWLVLCRHLSEDRVRERDLLSERLAVRQQLLQHR